MIDYELLTIKEVAETVQLSVVTVQRLVRQRQFIAPLKIGPATTRWRSDELSAWLEARPRSVDPAETMTQPPLAAA